MIVAFASSEFVEDELIVHGEITPDTEAEHENLLAYKLKYETGVFKFDVRIPRDKPKPHVAPPPKAEPKPEPKHEPEKRK